MTDYIEFDKLKQEMLVFIRNQDILSIAQRGVTTDTDTGTFSADTTHLIALSTIRNIRSITVAGSPLVFGTDYTVEYTFDDSSVYKCKITFTSAQTGDYVITYDTGDTDKVGMEYSAETLTRDDVPFITVDYGPSPTRPGGMGNVNETDIYFSLTILDTDTQRIELLKSNARKVIIANATSFYYMKSKYISPVGNGSILPSPNNPTQKILQLTLEFKSPFNYEKN